MLRFHDCCTVRAAFSPGESSVHRTRPVSFVTVICRLIGPGGGGGGVGEPEVELCVACAARDVEKQTRAAVLLRGIGRRRRVPGLRSWIASVGLYIADMASDVEN
jgi:hypothetical protein